MTVTVPTVFNYELPNGTLHQWVVEPATDAGAYLRYGARQGAGERKWFYFPAIWYDSYEQARESALRHRERTIDHYSA